MATISGRVIFDRDRSASVTAGDTGIANIPVVLQNVTTGLALTVLTDVNGNYAFTNVPNGNYRIVESYGATGGVPTPGNFSNAAAESVPAGVNPPISVIPNPPGGSTNLDSVTPNTLIITVSGNDLAERNFFDGPVIYTPFEALIDKCAIILGENLITAADNGTFGTFPQGTPANTGAPTEPYPGIAPDFTYVLPNTDAYAPFGGEYTVQNIMNNSVSNEIGAWWRIADHTTGNETGRMMVVNGYNPGAVFFRATVAVRPFTNYLFSAWILNLFRVTGYPNPQLGVRISDPAGNILYSATLGTEIPVNQGAPEWKQIGSVINSQTNTSLTVEFLSEGPEVIGNDYAIDDVELHEIVIQEFIPVKTADKSTASIGDIVEYTVRLNDTCTNPLTDVFFRDIIPNGLSLIPNSVTVNGTLVPSANPGNGFALPDVPGGGSVTVTFSAMVEFIPTPNPTLNTATITYSYTPVEGGIPGTFTVNSNEVPVTVAADLADISVTKTANPSSVRPEGPLTYTITVANAGPSPAENVILSDTFTNELTGVEYSLNGGATFSPWPGSLNFGTMPRGESIEVQIRGTVRPEATKTIVNTATVTSITDDPNPNNNTSTVTTNILTARCQALIDLIESVALQEAALANILNSEGAKMQTVIGMDNVTTEQLFELNCSVTSLIGTISRLEMILQAKLQSATGRLGDCSEEQPSLIRNL